MSRFRNFSELLGSNELGQTACCVLELLLLVPGPLVNLALSEA